VTWQFVFTTGHTEQGFSIYIFSDRGSENLAAATAAVFFRTAGKSK
jgi:hypothetical protein